MSLKKSYLLIAAALLMLALPLWAGGDNWVYIGETNDGEFYIHKHSIEDKGSYIKGWQKVKLSDTMKSSSAMLAVQLLSNSEPDYAIIVYGAQKESRQTKHYQFIIYDKNDNMIFSDNSETAWERCIPDSMNEITWEALMNAAGGKY